MAITSAPKRRALALRPTGRRLAQVARELATPRTLLVGGALVIVGYLAVVPLVYLLHDTFTGPAGLSIGAFTRAYSARSEGARRHLLLRRVSLPLVRPAIVWGGVLMFVQSLESFEVPGLLGRQNGIYV